MKTRIKKAYICKQVDQWTLQPETSFRYRPAVGDVGIFEVLEIGKHQNMQSDSKRNVTIMQGDQIMAAFGTRYATAQFEGYVPDSVHRELHILGAGGTIGEIKSMHARFNRVGPTKLRMIGLATDGSGAVINTKQLKQREMLPFTGRAAAATKVILSLGASMDSGKTTSAAHLARGLKKSGATVAYIKLTGTVYTKDADLAFDLGADMVADFSDYGFPSTYMCQQEELLSLYETLVNKVLAVQPDYVIVEVADGLFERETKMLLSDGRFTGTVDGVVFSAGDSLAAVNGIQLLHQWGIYPDAISGLLTASPLLVQEVAANTAVPVLNIETLAAGEGIPELFSKHQAFAKNS